MIGFRTRCSVQMAGYSKFHLSWIALDLELFGLINLTGSYSDADISVIWGRSFFTVSMMLSTFIVLLCASHFNSAVLYYHDI